MKNTGKFLVITGLIILAFIAGLMLQPHLSPNLLTLMPVSSESHGVPGTAEQSAKEKQPLYWVAPMDKNYRRDKPGKSPMGMDLVPVYEEDNAAGDTGGVKISPVVVSNLGVRTAEVTKGPLDLPIKSVGYIEFDENKLHHIHSRVDGWIEALYIHSNGEIVTKGQTLYELYSPALVNAQEEYLAALRSNNASLKKASASRLLSLGLTESQIDRLEKRREVDQRIKVIAEHSGIVKDLNVRQGMFIKPSTEVMSIGSLDSVWVIAEVFERQASWVKPDQKVDIRLEALPGRQWQGKVDYLYPVLDSKTRTLRVRVQVENKDLALKPNMYADLSILAPVAEQALSIPREALIKSGRYQRVVKVLADNEFTSVIVKAGIEVGGRIQILEGLAAGDRVVTSAQFLIDSESNIDAELARMSAREGQPPPDTPKAKTVTATGKVKELMGDMMMVVHDPIPEWEWPTMSMAFTVAEPEQQPSVKEGDSIRFTLSETDDGDYQMSEIKPMP